MLAKPQGFPRKLGGCAGLDPRLRSAVSAGVGDGERGLRRGLRAPGVGVRPKWVLEYSPSNKRIRYFVSITYVRTGLWTAHKFCGGGGSSLGTTRLTRPPHWSRSTRCGMSDLPVRDKRLDASRERRSGIDRQDSRTESLQVLLNHPAELRVVIDDQRPCLACLDSGGSIISTIISLS